MKEREEPCRVRLWVKVPKFGGGQGTRDRAGSLKIATSPDLVGLTVRKTIWLNSANDTIEIDQEVINTTMQSRAAALYIQQNPSMSGSHYSDNWYLPSTSGVRVNLPRTSGEGGPLGPTGSGLLFPVGWPSRIAGPNTGWSSLRLQLSQQDVHQWATGEWFLEPSRSARQVVPHHVRDQTRQRLQGFRVRVTCTCG
ncbi:MAG: hypothetical protein Ct9H300mP1_13730 [Planctomycetaceae bacterium]|nr:MAG: hypothetical protein Ct9H300mP1_13730 [Planctomycetaceae bacterium]